MQNTEPPQRNPGARPSTQGGAVRAIYLSVGGTSLLVLLGLAVFLLLSACGGRPTPLATRAPTTATAAPSAQTQPPKPTQPAATATNAPPTQTIPPGPTRPSTPGGHQGSEGLVLGADSAQETVYPGALCEPSVPVREYGLVAVNIEITLNRFLDYDPVGRMYVLEEDLERARSEEAQNLQARLGDAEPAVSIGLQGDAIQALTLRVNQGECLRLTLRNGMNDAEPVSLHLHGSGLHMADTGIPAIATNPQAIAQSGASVTYQWMVEKDEPEGTHYFHSHGNDRLQTSHGLFGALIVEPAGSRYLDPLGGGELHSGWAAIIQDPNGSNFREFAIFYHEIGNERFRNFNKLGRQVPFVDTFTGAYKPGGRAMNYRSEPFMNRLKLQSEAGVQHDAAQAYSSYTFGDPATPIARAYLGDPVKQRVVHGGSEVFHVHHVHGGATRWRRQPGVEPTAFDSGFDKNPPLLPQASARTDSQAVGPSESYDLENECGAGGCQHSVGDYLIHCHLAHHYIAGMWMIWRVYNTLQDGAASQDVLPPLDELPGRTGGVQPAVTSAELVDSTVDWKGQTLRISQANLAAWVERQLPPPGVPKVNDPSVLDWRKEGNLYLNEAETEKVWPGYLSPAPGQRPPLHFNPTTGKLAYPFLRPHLASRPPFAPNHGPAPFLEPFRTGTDPPQPGENGPWSLCPKGAKAQEFVIHAINLPITLSRSPRIIDPVGQLFVLKEEEDAVRANNGLKNPLAIRANAGEDCVDILFKSELEDTGENGFFSKANIHVHFVQFDVQGSDGVNTGFNYETSVRPFTVEGEKLADDAAAGDDRVKLGDTGRFQPGALVGVGMDQNETFEVRRILSIDGASVVFDEPLQYAHKRREIVSYEFVRYRWYPDVQFGTAYFHDHVSALTSWKHGLFGALISEPPGSTYRSPQSGEEVRSGPLVDVHTHGKVSADISGSFREMVLFIQDENTLTKVGRSAGSSLNLRVAPLEARAGDPSLLFSSQTHGDPDTPLLEAYLGDPLVIRGLVAATNDVHTLHVDGHWFRVEPYSMTSPPVSTVHIGISERYDLSIPKAGGPQRMPGDYLYYNGRSFKLREGSWGIIRVHDGGAEVALRKLPGHQQTPQAAGSVCPGEAIHKEFSVAAVDAPLPMLGEEEGRVYVLEEDKEAVLSGARPAQPLVLHINVGDCLRISLSNETDEGDVSFHADMLAYDPADSMGIAAGANPVQTVAPGQTRTYTFYAHPDVGETVALVRDWGNVLENPGLGLYGAVIVGSSGARYTDPVTGEDAAMKSSWREDVHPPDRSAYRDFSLFIQDEDEVIGTHIMPYSQEVEGVLGLNYRLEPLAQRLTRDEHTSRVFDSDVHGDPATPIIEAIAGDRVAIHVLVPFSEQAHVFTLEGHRWPVEPARKGSDLVSSLQVGALEAVTVVPEWGAGGREGLPGDYLYGDHREPNRQAGLWGIFRVFARDHGAAGIQRLPVP